MPLSFQRLAPRGFTDPREVSEKCNGLGDAVSTQLTPANVTVVETTKPFTVTDVRARTDNAVVIAPGIAGDFYVTNQVAGAFDIDWTIGGFVSTSIRYLVLG